MDLQIIFCFPACNFGIKEVPLTTLTCIKCDFPFSGEVHNYEGFPGGTSCKEPACQCRRHKRLGFDPWVRMFPWRRTWQPTPVLFPGESHGQRSLVGYGPKELDVTEVTGHAHTCLHKPFSSYQRALWVRIFCRFMKAPPLNN